MPTLSTKWGNAPKRLLEKTVIFKIYPARYMPRELRPEELTGRFYWKVIVQPDRASLHAYGSWRSPRDRESRYDGIVIPLHRDNLSAGGRRVSAKLGEVVLSRANLLTGVLSHESVHVATSTLRSMAAEDNRAAYLKLGEDIDDDEERLAYMICGVCRQIVDGLYARSVL